MKKLILTISFVALVSPAWASPYLICDPYPSSSPMPDYFLVKVDTGSWIKSDPVDVTGGKILKYDLAGVSAGDHRIEVKACQAADVWGEVCSDPAVFTFRRPSAPPFPRNVSLSR